MSFLYIVVRIEGADEIARVREAVGRPWLEVQGRLSPYLRYWVPSRTEAERERAVLFLAGFSSQIEGQGPAA